MVKKGDTVVVRRGKDRGKQGRIVRVSPQSGRVMVEGLNMVKKTMRPKRAGEKGQIIERPAAVPFGNVMLVCPHCGRPTRVAQRRIEGRGVRVCKKCQATLQ